MKTVLITGAGGFLGSHLCEKFLADGYQIIAVDNFCTGSRSNQTLLENYNSAALQKVIFIEADVIQGWESWLTKIPKAWRTSVRYIFHMASPASPQHYQALNLETLAVNSTGLQNALSFADSVKARLIFSSTSEVYGFSTENLQKESDWGYVNSFGERSCYNEAKRFGEALIYGHNKRNKTRHGLVRIFNTYGPRMNEADGRVVIHFLLQAQQNQPLTIFGDGSQTRSFCYVSDLIDGLYLYALSSLAEPVNLGNPTEFSIKDFAKTICEMFPQKNLQVVYHPLPQEDPPRRRPDITKAQQLLGWTPQVHLDQGLRQMSQWYGQKNHV